jgi:hypothetical protein
MRFRWVANLEQGYNAMWKRHESGLPPADINVQDDEPVFNKNASRLSL